MTMDNTPASKHKRLDGLIPEATNISIKTAADIKRLLTFDQNDIIQYRLSLQAFRKYLEQLEIKKAAGALKDGILLDYLTAATSTTFEDQVEKLPEIFQAWRYSVQVHDEGLMTAIPGVLATLLRTISSALEFVEIGVQICRNVIQRESSSILQKSLNSSRARDATIARCLDLLTQVVSFDGGACARNVWLQRSVTMQRLPQFLGMSKKTIYGPTESMSIRDHAITFFLTNLRYQDHEAKAEILSTRKTTQIMLRDVLLEKPYVIKEILSVLEIYVLKDNRLNKSAKGHVLTDTNLGFVLGIVRHDQEGEEWTAVHELAESFLAESCTSRTYGIVYKQYGWYPPGTEDLTLKQEILLLASQTNTLEPGKYKDRVPVRNTTLASFVLDLKPWSSIAERKLTLGIFEAAPELIADYFLRKKTFSFEPKLTATWIGWATFIYSTLQIPCTNYDAYIDGRVREPPPVPVIIQSILPQSLTRESLVKALKHKSELVRLFTVRILVASLKKLQSVLSIFQFAASPSAWKATAARILKELELRLPEYKQILNLYQSCSREKRILREILSSLLVLYNIVTPKLVTDGKMDVSLQITRMLEQIAKDKDNHDTFALMELENLIHIAEYTFEAKWWEKPANATITSMTTILQLLASSRLGENTKLKYLIRKILQEDYILAWSSKGVDSLEPLLLALRTVIPSDTKDIFKYLDDCLLRNVRKPIKYHGDIEDLGDDPEVVTFSPLFLVLLEQWPYFMKEHNEALNTACAKWKCTYLIEAANAGESLISSQTLCSLFVESTTNESLKQLFEDCKLRLMEVQNRFELIPEDVATRVIDLDPIEAARSTLDTKLGLIKETEDHPVLTRWSKKHVSDAIIDSDVAKLINYLSSTYPEVRIQAVSALRSFMNKVQSSNYEGWQSFYLLIGSLLETIEKANLETAVPSFVIAMASSYTLVLSNPLHIMFTKVNRFLLRAPTWNLAKMPSYWMDKIFNKPPTEPEMHWKEVEWLLETLLDGLRNQDDVNLYRQTGVFERIIINCTTAFAPGTCYEKMIDILYRCAMVGGATTLITRFGICPWIETQMASNPKYKTLLAALEQKIKADCDKEYVRKWAGGEMDWFGEKAMDDDTVLEEQNK